MKKLSMSIVRSNNIGNIFNPFKHHNKLLHEKYQLICATNFDALKRIQIFFPAYQEMAQKLLNLLPNLESLKMSGYNFSRENCTPMSWHIKLMKASAKCAIRKLEFVFWNLREPEDTIQKFLGNQEPILKSLLGSRLLNGFQDFRLEYLDFSCVRNTDASLEFLRHLGDLKTLKLRGLNYTDPICRKICELTGLECLELDGSVTEGRVRGRFRMNYNGLHGLNLNGLNGLG
jgi:hypothetical protein